jgi:hypothetical protein
VRRWSLSKSAAGVPLVGGPFRIRTTRVRSARSDFETNDLQASSYCIESEINGREIKGDQGTAYLLQQLWGIGIVSPNLSLAPAPWPSYL